MSSEVRRAVFFSSRRRHTRLSCDWSLDVCSSDLIGRAQAEDGIRDYRVTGVQRVLFRSDRKSTRLNSSHTIISYAVFCLDRKSTSRRRHTRLSCDWSSACALPIRSEEHTSELQSHDNLVCRLLLRSEEHKQKTAYEIIV